MDEGKYYGLDEVAAELKVAYLTVYRWVQAGKLKAHQVGKQYRIAKDDLDTFLESRKTKVAPKLQELNRDELISMIKQIKQQKKFGLIWEDKPEDVAEQCKRELPVLEEVKGKAIIEDANGSTNLLIEGDNYHSLSVLNYTHAGRIDVIYIDPPYNTGGNGFRYNDQSVDATDSFRHSKWLSFMANRLRLARNLLSNTGVLFCSIDDHEVHNLRQLLDEVFQEKNFIGQIVVQSNPRGRQAERHLATVHEYLLVYAKDKNSADFNGLQLTEKQAREYKLTEPNGRRYRLLGLRQRGAESRREDRPNMYFPLYVNQETGEISVVKERGFGVTVLPRKSDRSDSRWMWSKSKVASSLELLEAKMIARRQEWDIFVRDYLVTGTGEERTSKSKTIWAEKELNYQNGKTELMEIFNKNIFDYPKPTTLIKMIVELASPRGGLILDFFAGSGTTGHAVLKLNNQDGGQRSFILCTNNESSIAEAVTYPRIKSVVKGYGNTKGIPANLRYFRTAFVSKSLVSDDTRRGLVGRSVEMICVRENTFEKLTDKVAYKIYQDKDHITGILFDLDSIDSFKRELEKQKLPTHIYVFSLGNDTFNDDFADLALEYKLCPIPESILEVYRKLFKTKKQ